MMFLDDTFEFGKFHNKKILEVYAQGRIPQEDFEVYIKEILQKKFSNDFSVAVTSKEIVFPNYAIGETDFDRVYRFIISESATPTEAISIQFYENLKSSPAYTELDFKDTNSELTFLERRRAIPQYVEFFLGFVFGCFYNPDLDHKINRRFFFSPENLVKLEEIEISEPNGIDFKMGTENQNSRIIKYNPIFTFKKHTFSKDAVEKNFIAYQNYIEECEEDRYLSKRYYDDKEGLCTEEFEEPEDETSSYDLNNLKRDLGGDDMSDDEFWDVVLDRG